MNKNQFHFEHPTLLDKARNQLTYLRSSSGMKISDYHREHANEIKQNGFVQIDNFLSPEVLSSIQSDINDRLKKGLFSYPTLAQSKIDPIKHKDLIDNYLYGSGEAFLKRGIAFEKKDFKSYEQVLSEFKPSTLNFKIPSNRIDYFNIWLDSRILGIVEAYMGLHPYLLEAYVRRNFPSPYRTMNHFWHRDLNHKFHLLKAFIFFTDTDLSNGPHEFVSQTHNDFTLNGKRYYEDGLVEKTYPENSGRIQRSVVKAGTLVIEDTRGLHKASLPEQGFRDLGYAVFMPLPWFKPYRYKNFEVNRETFQQLNDSQKSFIPKAYIV